MISGIWIAIIVMVFVVVFFLTKRLTESLRKRADDPPPYTGAERVLDEYPEDDEVVGEIGIWDTSTGESVLDGEIVARKIKYVASDGRIALGVRLQPKDRDGE